MKNVIFLFLSGLVLLLITIELQNTVNGKIRRRRRRRCEPSPCKVSGWSPWSNCSFLCGTGGIQNRTRLVIKKEYCEGFCRYDLSEIRSCNNDESDCHFQGRPHGEDYCACKAGYTRNCCDMECGGDVRGKSGRIQYEGWPGSVVGNCTWEAHTNKYSTVSTKMDRCSLQVSSYIEIRDGEDNHAPLMKNITQSDCIAGLIHVGYTPSNKMSVRLISSTQLEQKIYFDLTFHECGGVVEETSGRIQSPFYPESYVKDGMCSWEIQTPYATVISSTFHNFTLRYSEDFVQMGNVQGVTDIGLYKNNATPIENVADTKGNRLWVSMEALDLTDSDSIEPCGFEMEFQSKLLTTEEYTSYNGSVFSPLYPFPYPTNITFETKISTPEGTIVSLGFTELQLRRGDNVSVYDDGAKLIVAYVHGDDPGMETVIVRSNVSYVVLYSGIGDNTTNGSYSLGFEALPVCLATDNEGNGDIYPEEDYYLPGEVVTVVCHTGFESSTNYTNVTCEEGGSWDTKIPVCTSKNK
ncbi:tolloid-like protein 2 [Ptychodera flava]|uniref:tolloid-like protein 2 n=1 Tax=Ptychodera flava TaxID=63121 RepID=UPI00396A73E3